LADHQRELQHKNLFLHTVLDSIQDGISVLNRDLSVRLTNKVMEKWYATRLPFAGKKCHEVYHLREKPCDPCPSRRALTSGKPEVELVPGPSNGHVKWLELHAYPLKNPETGDTEGIVEFVRDVTERMEAQEALRRIHAAVEQAQNFIVITDAHGGIVYVNPYFEKYTGYSLDQVRGALPLVFQSLADGERVFREEVLPELHKGMVWSKTMHAFIQDGSKVHVDLTASPVLDDAGRLVNIVFVARDVTREKQLESQLFQAQKMESVGQLAGGIAHDFNNLLQIINGYADMALNRLEAPHPVHRYLQRIREAGERAASLVQQLLAFSRRQVMDPKPLDLNGLIEDLLTMLTRLLGEHIVIRFEPEPSLDLIYGDKTMLEQVVINLCVNARDAMPEGGDLVLETHDVTVDEAFCKKHPWAKPGRYALMSVSDTGHGMDAATIQRIFDPFFTTKEMGRGTGLGLATVYGVVKQHQGMIHVYSEPGMGSTFKIYLPLAPGEVSTGAKKDRPQSAVQGGREVILVAEDNREVLEFISETLRNFGYTVVEAHTGAEVVAIMEKDPGIQLVILDVVMPEMSGWEAYTALKAMRPEVPVLFMSGYTENVVHTNFVVKSGCRLIQKPFTPEKLLHEIQKILQEKSGHP
jgi:PAS domain S-box-containing protein